MASQKKSRTKSAQPKAVKAQVPPVKQLKCGMALFGTAAVMASSVGLSGLSAAPAFAADTPGNATAPAVDGVNVIDTGTTQTDAQNSVNGMVVEAVGGNPLTMLNTDTDTPLEGVRVYAQWYEKDGSASPIYTGTTGADGTYHIVMNDFVKPDGTVASFDADPLGPESEKFRVWAETPDGMYLWYSWETLRLVPRGGRNGYSI